MSSLRDRLQRLDRGRTAGRPGPAAQPTDADRLRTRLDRILGTGTVVRGSDLAAASHTRARGGIERFVHGQRVARGGGSVFVTEWLTRADEQHGRLPVAALARPGRDGARDLFPRHLLPAAAEERVVYVDTETTGLAGGAGTIPFLVGVGRWSPESGGFRVTQFFLEDLDREEHLLAALAEELSGAACLVTYNGRSYDLPMLENRYVLNRLPFPVPGTPHLDLLHPARRLWKHANADCRLSTLERSVLGFRRHGDVPGAEIPALYGAYLRYGADARMAAIFRHNRDDLLSLAGLLWAAGQEVRAGRGAAAVAAGRIQARSGLHGDARRTLERSLEAALPRGVRKQALRELSLMLKKEGEWARALTTWAEMRELDPADPFPVAETAKALEHRLGDLPGALRLVEEALEGVLPWTPGDRQALEHRRSRLRRRLGR